MRDAIIWRVHEEADLTLEAANSSDAIAATLAYLSGHLDQLRWTTIEEHVQVSDTPVPPPTP